MNNIQNYGMINYQVSFHGGKKPSGKNIRNIYERMKKELGGSETKEIDEARRALQSTGAAKRHELVDMKNKVHPV